MKRHVKWGLVLVVALLVVSFSPVSITPAADAQVPGNSQPYPGNPHWLRQVGVTQVNVQFHVDSTAKALRPFLVDAANSWNANSPNFNMVVLPLGGDCRGQTSYCVTVAESNSHACGNAQTFLSWTGDSSGHYHMNPALIAGNFQDCGLTLLWVKVMFCHESGHAQGVDHDPPSGQRPCDWNTGMPMPHDVNVRNILHSGTG